MKRIAIYFLALAFFSCKKEDPIVTPEAYENGLIILNEGLYQQNNASISFFSLQDQRSFQQCFVAENDRGLGDTANDFEKFSWNGTEYIIIAVDVSSQLEIVEANTLQSVARIPVLDGTSGRGPRQLLVEGAKAYSCNYDGTISVIDLETNSISNTISVGKNPDGMAIRGNFLYVSNSGGLDAPAYDSTISVIDLITETLVQTIDVRINPGEIILDSQGELYVQSRGNYSDVGPAWVRINEENEPIATYEKNFSVWTHAGDWMYYYDLDEDGVYRFNLLTETFDENQLIDCSAFDIPYSMTVWNEHLYLSDANGYVNSSTVHCYLLNGQKQYEFTAGLNANEIIINE